MADRPRLGAKVRALRRREKLTQAAMADRLSISASYLNLIEHNHRPLTAPLLIKLAQAFAVDVADFAADDDERLASELLEVFSDPLFDEHGLRGADVKELVAQVPAAARAITTLYAAWRESREAAHSLAAQITGEIAGVDANHLPSEQVSAFIHSKRNHFAELEGAAEALRGAAGDGPLGPALSRHLEHRLGVRVVDASVERMRGALRRLDRDGGRLWMSESPQPAQQAVQLAHVAGLLSSAELIESLIDAPELTSDSARTVARVAMANYLAGAVLMPYERFLVAAEQTRYDVELLGHKFQAGFEQVCHRLTTLNRPGAMGVPLHFLRVDIAGNISKRFSGSGIRVARFSGACPRWNVHAAFMTPGRIRVQLSQMPDGKKYFCIAQTVQRSGAGFRDSHTVYAIGLGCPVSEAHRLVYAEGVNLDGAAVPVGVTCRTCPRLDCAWRAMPPVERPMDVDADVRGLSFYAPVGD